jgi:hypothetical protein
MVLQSSTTRRPDSLILGLLVVASTWFPTHAAAADAKAFKANSKICARIGKALGHGPGVPSSLYVDSIDGEGRQSIYQGIDVDGDGAADSVKQDCGSPSYGMCSLYIGLSKGGGYEFEEEVFSLIRYRSRYYVVVGDTYPEKKIHRRLYVLSARGVDRVCKSF